MNTQEMGTFIKMIAKSHGIDIKRSAKGKTLSVPVRSMVDGTLFFEFHISSTRLRQIDVAIHLCVQDAGNMSRVSALYLNGMWKNTPYREEIELYIQNNIDSVFNELESNYVKSLVSHNLVEEEFFPSLESEVNVKYMSRLRESQNTA